MAEAEQLHNIYQDDDIQMTERMVKIVDLNTQKAHVKGAPIAKYDRDRKAPYLLYPDGTRSYSL